MVHEEGGEPVFGGTTAHLTRQECDILAAAARGLGTSEVAAELGLAVAGVRAALASAMGKLGASSKLEAVVLALRRGDIDL
jgi:DNA-binding CsgD family transcriptional regulator